MFTKQYRSDQIIYIQTLEILLMITLFISMGDTNIINKSFPVFKFLIIIILIDRSVSCEV
jgi:hypothetical protein